ncbi:hypothetical protein Cch01nite_06150 [Cellulomonas chitinilytica]|uniref:DUF4012 domain-containing protein n=1 Tax=Cellulomonas chitinilytica TaxID=398759 RepID=A0A919P1E8_9CELL|nr:hypothetical protein [Cellulomonas chitinilytica]GIG19891.1 hypothetical protein Cch01nite_06150 [Cellulomonas chitinilytica]
MPEPTTLLPPVRPVARPVVAKRGEPAPEEATSPPVEDGAGRGRSRTRKVVVRGVWSVVGLLVLSLVWVGARGALAVQSLVGAAPAMQDVASALSEGPTPTVLASVSEVRGAVGRARGLLDDPVWRLYEHVPGVGGRMASVRATVEAADVLADDALPRVVDLAGTLTFGPFDDPDDGYAMLVRASEHDTDLAAIAGAVQQAHARLDGVGTDLVVPELTRYLESALGTLDAAADVAAVASPSVHALLEVAGGSGPTSTAVVFLDDTAAKPLGGRVERVLVLTAEHGAVREVRPVDPGTVLAAATASAAYTTAAAGPQAALVAAGAPDVARLTSTADASAALQAGVAAATGTAPAAVVLVTAAGMDDLLGASAEPVPAAPSFVATLAGLPPEGRAGAIDATVETVVRGALTFQGRADLVAFALRDAVTDGGLRVWFADPAVQGALAGSRGAGGLPADPVGGTPVVVSLDAGTGPAGVVADGLVVAQGTCGRLWAERPGVRLTVRTAPGVDGGSAARLLVQVPARTDVAEVAVDGTVRPAGDALTVDDHGLLVVDLAAGTSTVEVSLRGRADDGHGVQVVSRGGMPAAVTGSFSC